MFAGIGIPSGETLAWMGAAAIAGAIFGGLASRYFLPVRFSIWWDEAFGMGANDEDVEELTAFQSRNAADEAQKAPTLAVMYSAAIFAFTAWALIELDPGQEHLLLAVGALILVLGKLLLALQKSDDELEAEQQQISPDPMAGPPSFMQRAGGLLAELAWAAVMVAFASEWFFGNELPDWRWWAYLGLAAIAAIVFWQTAGHREGDRQLFGKAEASREAVLSGLFAVAIVLFLVAVVSSAF